METIILDKSSLRLNIDSTLYSADVIHKCFYWYGNRYSVDISRKESLFTIELANIAEEDDMQKLIQKIKKDLIDFKTREIVSVETKNIREILIAKAFASEDEFNEPPPGNIDDPVGFDPSKF
ncbi:MAG: His-Xaa-Ser system protein HxsD [Bacteroidetes bacterium]|nr:MAG: His-Xaa-Ser system protein HxsD [Bacteroidota bacterium]